MSDLAYTRGVLLRQIMTKENLKRLHPGLPVWEMPGTGYSTDENRRRLLAQVLADFPASLLRYEQDDRDLVKLKGDWRCLAPSFWIIPRDVDPEGLYDLLSGADWAIVVTETRIVPPLHYREFDKLLIWMRYAGVPLVLESHHWRGRWVVSVNPDLEESRRAATPETPHLDRHYPTVSRLLGIWMLDSGERGLSDEEELVRWLGGVISEEDRDAFLEETEGILGRSGFPWEEVEAKAGGKRDASYEARDWLARVCELVGEGQDIEAGKRNLAAAIESVIDSFRAAFVRRQLTAVLEGYSLRSSRPYDLDARVSFYFWGNMWWDYDVREYVSSIVIPGFRGSRKDKVPLKEHRFICTAHVPLFRNGRRIHEGIVRDVAVRELRSFLSWWPLTKLLASTQYPVFGTGWNLVILALLLISVVILAVWQIVPRLFR